MSGARAPPPTGCRQSVVRLVTRVLEDRGSRAVRYHKRWPVDVRRAPQSAPCRKLAVLYSDSDPEIALRNLDRSYELAERHGLPLVGAMAAAEAATAIARLEEPGRGRVQLCRALRSFIVSGNPAQLWTGAHSLAFFLTRAGHMDDARAIWEGLGSRPAYTGKHLRDELTELLGDPGENQLSDDELSERIRAVLHDLERDDLESTAQGA